MQHKQRDSRFLQGGHYLGMEFDDDWWFVSVTGTEYEEVKPWTLKNSNDNRAKVSGNTSGVNDQNIEDPNGNMLLEPDDQNRNIIHQILFGVAPSRMQVFRLFGRDRNNAVQNYDEPGEPASYISGNDSPYDNPSSTSEFIYINSMAPVRLQPYNPTDTALEATVSFHIQKLKYVTITDKSLMRAMIQGQTPAHLVMMGLGVDDANQIGVPTWLNEAFGEHLYTTEEILQRDEQEQSNESSVELASGGSLERQQ